MDVGQPEPPSRRPPVALSPADYFRLWQEADLADKKGGLRGDDYVGAWPNIPALGLFISPARWRWLRSRGTQSARTEAITIVK